MSDKLDDARFWLPSEFLTEEDIVMNSYGVSGRSSRSLNLAPELGIKHHRHQHGFFTPSTGSVSPVESSVSEEEGGDSLGTELTQLLTLLRASRLSQRSQNHESFGLTGSGLADFTGLKNGSGRYYSPSIGPLQASSHPNAPGSGNDDAWDLIYKAASQVAKLNNAGFGSGFGFGSRLDPQNSSLFTNSQLSRAEILLRRELQKTEEKIRLNFEQSYMNNGGVSGGGFNSFPYANNQHLRLDSGVKSGFGFGLGYGSGPGTGEPVKSERVGTGVFLPRRYGTSGAGVTSGNGVRPTRQKLGYASLGVQANKANPALNNSNGGACLQSQPRFVSGGVVGENDLSEVVARRAAMSKMQKTFPESAAAINHDVCLPQEWTY